MRKTRLISIESQPKKKYFICVVASGGPTQTWFLAAMSSSRSDVVTQCVRVSVFSCFRPFFSFNVLEVSSSGKVFQLCFKAV